MDASLAPTPRPSPSHHETLDDSFEVQCTPGLILTVDFGSSIGMDVNLLQSVENCRECLGG